MQKLIILIIGLPGSGKSFAGEVIKKNFDAFVIETGDIIREEIKRRGLRYNPENDKKMRDWFHPKRERILFKRVWSKLKKSRKNVIAVVGFRSVRDLEMLKRFYKGKIVTVSVVSSFKMRAAREMKRKRFGKSETLKYIRERDKEERRIGMDRLLKMADYRIDDSELSKKQMERKIIRLMRILIKQI